MWGKHLGLPTLISAARRKLEAYATLAPNPKT